MCFEMLEGDEENSIIGCHVYDHKNNTYARVIEFHSGYVYTIKYCDCEKEIIKKLSLNKDFSLITEQRVIICNEKIYLPFFFLYLNPSIFFCGMAI
jgi:hypothetical protein